MPYIRKEMAGKFRKKVGALDIIEQAHQLVLKARDMGRSTVPYVQSYIRQVGDVRKEFGLTDEGLATKVGNPEGRSLAINDILSNYTHYTLTPKQVEIAKRQGFVYEEALKLARSYDVDIKELGNADELWQYVARRVKGKRNPVTGLYEMPPPTIGGFKMGAKISAQKERIFEEMIEGVDVGFLYEQPDQVMAHHIQGIYRLIGNKQAQKMVMPLTRQITKEFPLKFGERAIAEPAMRSRAATVEVANAIDRIYTPEQVNQVLRTTADISGAMVGQIAALDVSAPFIQGGPGLGHDLKMGLLGHRSTLWAESYGKMWQSIWNPERINVFRMENAADYKRFIEYGMLTSQSEFVSGVGAAERALAKIPKAGQTVSEAYRQIWGRMGQAYSDFLEIWRFKFIKQMEPVWQREGRDMFELGALSNRMSGTVSAEARGIGPTRKATERILAFAPNYLRASFLLIKDMISTGAKAREVQASIAAMLGLGASFYYVEEKMRGQEPKMKPWPKKFGGDGAEAYTFGIGDTRVGFGGWTYGMIKCLAEIGAVAVDDPGALIVWNGQHPVVKFLKSKRGAAIGLATELVTGRNFWGQKFNSPNDYLLRIAESIVPISGQSLLEKPELGMPRRPVSVAARVGGEFMGLRAFPYALKSQWIDKDAKFKNYFDIPSSALELEILRKKNPNKIIKTRTAYRKSDPEVDAKLFIVGEVTSLQSSQAVNIAKKLIQDNEIDPMQISGIEDRMKAHEDRKKAGVPGLKANAVDRLITLLGIHREGVAPLVPRPVTLLPAPKIKPVTLLPAPRVNPVTLPAPSFRGR